MTGQHDQEWWDEIASKAGLTLSEVKETLEGASIRPSPILGSPTRLTLKRITFSGEKVGAQDDGPFKFDWGDLQPGLWAMVTEKNLRGKTSVLEIVRWMLRGRFTDHLEDVRGWLHHCVLRFELGAGTFEVRADVRNRSVSGSLAKIVSSKRETTLVAFQTPAAFEDAMSSFFLEQLGLTSITRRQQASDDSPGSIVTHGWPSLCGALLIGTDYSVLLGDVPVASGVSVPLMQMYLGVPWISTLTAAKARLALATASQAAQAKKRAAIVAKREARTEELKKQLASKEAEMARVRSDEDARKLTAAAQSDFAKETLLERQQDTMLSRAAAELREATAAYATDKAELQTHLDSEAAGAVFRQLLPSFCPRCDTTIGAERVVREASTHACCVCGEQVVSDTEAEALKSALEGRLAASKKARDDAAKAQKAIEETLASTRGRIGALDTQLRALSRELGTFGEKRRLELELSAISARLAEASLDDDPPPAPTSEIAVLQVAVDETEKRVKSVQTELLKAVSERIVEYAQSFGLQNLTSAELRGNGTLPLEKGGTTTSYGKCTDGEKLRLKVATILAMISVAEARGVGRHPGLLMIDSPGAQEIADEDLAALMKGLAVASKELGHLQLIVAGRSSSAISASVAADHLRAASGSAPLW
jgi:hypothetical protein